MKILSFLQINSIRLTAILSGLSLLYNRLALVWGVPHVFDETMRAILVFITIIGVAFGIFADGDNTIKFFRKEE